MKTPLFRRMPRHGVKTSQGGFAMLEALVAMVIFAIGTLGIVGLQAAMTRAQSASKYRADAAYLAQQAIGQMWTDTAANRARYASGCSGYGPCAAWAARVASQLPAGAAAVTVNGSNVEVAVTWTVPADGTRVYRTSTAITL